MEEREREREIEMEGGGRDRERWIQPEYWVVKASVAVLLPEIEMPTKPAAKEITFQF